MVKVQIICPSCSKTGYIELADNSIKNILRGLLAINIASNIICPHTFIVYVDKNFGVRDYFIADFQIEIPDISTGVKIEKERIPGRNIVDIDLIKLNLPAPMLTYVLSSYFLRQKIVLLFNQEFLYNHIYNFFEYISKETFEIDLSLKSREEYNKNKKNYKKSMVFENTSIINNVKNIINPKKLYVEKQIVNKFFTTFDLGYSYIVLKNEIQKTYKFSRDIVNFINERKKKNEKVNILKINSQLEKIYGIKIGHLYLNFLINTVKNYFGIAVPSFRDAFINSLK